MNSHLQAVKVTDKVYWVGAIDWNLRNFHGYTTEYGSTYNAFLVLDEKITLIDTVKAPFFDEMLARIASVVDPARIDYIVSNHSEMDHSGSLPRALEVMKPEKLFASPMGEKALKLHFGDLGVTPVKTGDAIKLGASTLHFVETKMLHWPDSMVTYIDTEKLLFSQDAFGMHLAGSGRWYTDYAPDTLDGEARKYFANILLPYSAKILELLDSLPTLGLDIEIFAPDHGPMWRGDGIAYILNLYRECAEQKPKKRAVVIYDTMWHSTEIMAKSVADGLICGGLEVDQVCLGESPRSIAITKVLDAGVVVVGSPTLNNNLYPKVADFLTYMRGLKPQNLLGGAFGAYGWSGEATAQIGEYFAQMGVPQPFEPVKARYVPTPEDLKKCWSLGNDLANKLSDTINHGEEK